jgi:glucose uptake protein
MLLPTTHGATLLALALAALLWGIWANTQRADRKWRFELYALDFAIGALLTALALALTIGNLGSSNSFTFEDNLTVASKRSMALALGSGALFGLGQIMVLSGVALAGMSTALPVAAVFGLLTAAGAFAFLGHKANTVFVSSGAAAAVAALLALTLAQRAAAAASPVKKGMHPAWKGLILSSIGGLLSAPALLLVESSRAGDTGLGSYAAVVFMAAGLFLITPLVCIYFLNMPVQGAALSFLDYRKGTRGQHLLGILGGAIWAGGTVAFYAASGAAASAIPPVPAMLAIASSGAVPGALCGFFLWNELSAAPAARAMVFAALALLAGASTLFYLAV